MLLSFTRVALGDGQLAANEDILALTAIKNERLSAPIAQFEEKGNGMFAVQFRVSNQSVETGFWHREIGLMARVMGKNNCTPIRQPGIKLAFYMIRQRRLKSVSSI